eukprot:TRINITY_DN920_c7_g1_i1.p2 TRINITY_DN920_c7_g1~~TRINITY_DN920_c7_g1_i1.p2  ORF type:complete len:103 (+),score=2.34 TRINITY_DN920_c7_g1_i1:243-551(+)
MRCAQDRVRKQELSTDSFFFSLLPLFKEKEVFLPFSLFTQNCSPPPLFWEYNLFSSTITNKYLFHDNARVRRVFCITRGGEGGRSRCVHLVFFDDFSKFRVL